jgi:ABC-type multidrug transport system fused ATPase/permease subunit
MSFACLFSLVTRKIKNLKSFFNDFFLTFFKSRNNFLFPGGTNLFLNGVVLGTLYYGGYLLSVEKVTPGDLMSFLVATQTIQRSIAQMSLLFGHFVRGYFSCFVL